MRELGGAHNTHTEPEIPFPHGSVGRASLYAECSISTHTQMGVCAHHWEVYRAPYLLVYLPKLCNKCVSCTITTPSHFYCIFFIFFDTP